MNGLTRRKFADNQDYLAMREMLIDGYLRTGKPCNMLFYYLDNWRFANGDEPHGFFADRAVLWCDGDRVAAFSILDNESLYNLQVHPQYAKIVPVILEFLTQTQAASKTAIYAYQSQIAKYLEPFCFCSPEHINNEYEYDLTTDAVEVFELPDGYKIYTADQLDDLRSVYKAKALAFPRPHMTEAAVEPRMALKQDAPSYSNDGVYTVIREADRACVSFAEAWFDPISGVVGFEPIGTIPEERKKGLCKALLSYVFKRCREAGYQKISIRTGENFESAANYLYRSLSPVNVFPVMEYGLRE